MFINNRPKIGLALGAGGSKGLAHIGVIKVLEENNLPVDFIAGSSIGAIIGGFYAAKKDIREIEQIALKTNWPQILPMLFEPSLRGIIGGEKIKNFLKSYLGNITFKDLQIPFSAVATDLSTAKTTVLNRGELTQAIRASISVPVFFKPVEINRKLYIDGGVSMPVPVQIVRDMGANIVIAVNLGKDYSGIETDHKFGLKKITDKSIDILTRTLAEENVKTADLVICPGVAHIGLFNRFLTEKGTQETILVGELAMKQSLDKINNLVNNKKLGIGSGLKFWLNKIKTIFKIPERQYKNRK